MAADRPANAYDNHWATMKWLRKIWADPVWSKVISAGILYLAVKAPPYLPGISITEVGRWFNQPVRFTHGDVVNTVLSTLIAALSVTAAYIFLRRLKPKPPEVPIEVPTSTPEPPPDLSALQPDPRIASLPPRKFEPDSFTLTPPRCRALLVLLTRVDSITTLHDLHQAVAEFGIYADPEIHKGQMQHDMDDAERAGLVEIDRIGDYTRRYRLTQPDGRDWVLSKQADFKAKGVKGMKQRDARSRY